MTSIILTNRLEDSASDTEPVLSSGWRYRVRPSVDYVNGSGDQVLAEWPTGGGWKSFAGAAVTLLLDPLDPDVPYYLELQGPPDPTAKDRKPVTRSEYRQVLAGTTNGTSWYALNRVSGPGPSGVDFPMSGYDQLAAQIAAFQAQLDALVLSGGSATSLATLTGVSADGKTLIDTGSTFATMRTDLQVAPLASPVLTGNPTAPTPTAGDNDTSIATTAFVTSLLGSGTVTTNNPTFTGTTDLVNLDVSGTTAFAAGSIAQAAVASLVTDLSGKAATSHTHAYNTLTGLPTLPSSPGDVGLDNVNNTADIDKPIPTTVALKLAQVRVPWKQVGSLYPTPPPTGFYGIAYEGVNDPADQAGLTVTNNDTWTQLQA